jgi:predicted AlkP superfamily phosphohydrolase/phosphomutase
MKKSRLFALLLALATAPLLGYVGPGAGFAFVGSFFFIFAAFFLAIFNFLTFPLRALFRFIRRSRTMSRAKFRRVVIVGFDGMDFNLMKRFQREGKKFPAFEKLAAQGTFSPLWSSEPPVSPVAWSTFSTGVNPGKHNIFDFLTTDRQTYMPKLSGSDILPPKRSLKIGQWLIPLSSPKIELKRKSQSFWKIVSARGIYSAVLRVPFTFPPEKFYGAMLSGLGTPDLRGTQGTFTFFTDGAAQDFDLSEGVFAGLEKTGGDTYRGTIQGPGHPFKKGNPPLQIGFTLKVNRGDGSGEVRVDRDKVALAPHQLSAWQAIEFKAGWAKVSGVAQWVLEGVDPVRLYLSPINLNPEKPAMPISHPKIYSVYLAKLHGTYATLGMAEDTWSVNEGILSERAFIDQVYNTQQEREKVFFDVLGKIKSGLIVQVFEATDRVQHMCWRYLPGSKSPAPKPASDPEVVEGIARCYGRMDAFLEKLLAKLKPKDLLLIVSDHGFNAFDREFHLNTWLHRQGYLALKPGKSRSDKWYADVDWSKSRAYGQGLNGIFLNLKGRESEGIVEPGEEAQRLKREIKEKLLQARDEERGQAPVKAAFIREEIYRGPYVENAPDIVVGYRTGYRVSWESAVNYVGDRVFSDNTRPWSGDHCFTRDQVPGIFYSNRKIGEKDPGLVDIAPTVFAAFGIPKPAFIDGRDLKVQS